MAAPDAYEREHMAGIGEVLYRQKVHAPRWAVALAVGLPFGLAVAASIGRALSGASLLAALVPAALGAAYAVLMSGVFVLFAGGRIAVSEGELHVQIGPAGPRIAIDDIEACEVGPSGVNNYGLGARMHLDGTTIYSMLGDNRRAVRIRRRNGKPIVLVCPDAEGVVGAVAQARARRAAALPKVRMEAPAGDADLEDETSSSASSRSER